MASNQLLTEDPFNTEQSQKLFEVIDELHSCGAKAYVDLPEIVIVGDQSAGKSSLLQSLTEIPFPVAGRLCTRFPTRIVSRRTPGGPDITKISIEASASNVFPTIAQGDREKKYANFRPIGVDLSEDDFTKAVDDAMRLMDINTSTDPAATPLFGAPAKANFSGDILRIELSGPNRSHFSILDVPGVFHSRTGGITAQDMDGVKKLVSEEMRRRQSIIVCVASGTGDLATQAIFEMASQEDPAGERTVGVITKCDVTQHSDLAVKLARNDPNGEKYFRNGWFVVRNRSPEETKDRINAQERHKREDELFNSLPWNKLPSSRRGVLALKKHLGDLLCTRMQAAFPTMLSEIQEQKKSTALILEALGPARLTIEQKRTYLAKIAQRFHATAQDVLRGRYDAIDTDKLKLRKEIRDANDRFARELKRKGHRLPFKELPILQFPPYASKGEPQETESAVQAPITRNEEAKVSQNGLYFAKSEPLSVNPKVPDTMSRSPWPSVWLPNLREREGHSSQTNVYKSISAIEPFSGFSVEELRLKDYIQGQTQSQAGASPFGALPKTATPSASGGLFSQAPTATKPSPSGVPPSTLGIFGKPLDTTAPDAKPATSLFTSTPSSQTNSLFSSATNGAGTAPQTQASSTPFGQNNQGFGSGIGLAANSNSQPKTSLFGGFGTTANDKPAPSAFGSASNNAVPSTGGFGSASNGESSKGLFGSAPETKPSASLFGSATKPESRQPTSGGLFAKPGASPNTPNASSQPSKNSNVTPKIAVNNQYPATDIYEWIKDEIKTNRGTELQGTLNPDILPILFHKQSSEWGTIAEVHFFSVVDLVQAVLKAILEDTGCHETTRKKIWPRILEASDTREEAKIKLLQDRLSDIASRHLQTSNTAFEDKVAQARFLRFQAALDRHRVAKQQAKKASNRDEEDSDDPFFIVDMRDTAALFAELHMSNARNLENEIHDTLKAYYEIAREDFTEYVTQHIVESFINSDNGPVLQFSPVYVAGLSDADIEDLAMEDGNVARERTEKQAALERLKRAERVAQRYA